MNPDDLLKILLAIAVGGAIGLEREFRDKAAGLRTMIFICVGSALFTILSLKLGAPDNGDPTRIASNIVAGVGFLGAGVILRDHGRVIGLTTAAAVWLVAALGMGIGAGQSLLVLFVAAVTLMVLLAFPWLERWVDATRDERLYTVVTALQPAKRDALERVFRDSGLRILDCAQTKADGRMTCRFKVAGPRPAHARLVAQLLADPSIEELRY